MNRRSRNYVFTHNNPEEAWDPQAVFDVSEIMLYLAGQYERGEETGTLHFQGYVHFQHPIGIPRVKKELGGINPHIERRKGTHEEALRYVHKEETRVEGSVPFEAGEPPAQGERSDLAGLESVVRNGGTLLDCFDSHFASTVRYNRGLERAISLFTDPRNSPPETYYFWGASGSGKSRAAWEMDVPSAIYSVPLASGKSIWFDGYIPGKHTVVLIDDYYHNWKLTFFLQLLDRYPLQVPTKGGFTEFNSPTIVVTSNAPLSAQYPHCPDQKALWRRFKRVVRFEETYSALCVMDNPLGNSAPQ